MRRVIKIGGSLMTHEDLVEQLPRWLDAIAQEDRCDAGPTETLLIVGGGNLIEAIREWDRLRPSDLVKTHWRCIELLQHTFEIIGEWFPSWPQIDSRHGFDDTLKNGFSNTVPTLVAVRSFYTPEHDGGLPQDWRTTSDSLAGMLANESAADELVLLKSCVIDPTWNIAEMVDRGVVDPAFCLFTNHPWKLRVVSF
ncbi:Amino acid kinase family protein [Novipirellula galeiformis]|uniref:Amino acid kinase family protein n=1 Tax=Novipirellula galeiformis TaxID=2528004 RepID=A0A5C6CE75_9BACT|nr:hypothetical protein [Novipirellula galeiformis]TWU21596.1 Amino acid kinase family protein [Novipirellula galeiformis]